MVCRGASHTVYDGQAEILLRRKQASSGTTAWKAHINDTFGRTQILFYRAAKRLKTGKRLIFITNCSGGKQALNHYRKRWRIKCLFDDTKTLGLKLEQRRIGSPEKRASLIAIAALAMVWAYRCATIKMGLMADEKPTDAAEDHGSTSVSTCSGNGST